MILNLIDLLAAYYGPPYDQVRNLFNRKKKFAHHLYKDNFVLVTAEQLK